MKTRKKPLFYKIYFSVLGVFAVLLVLSAVFLHRWLYEYNEGIPETVSARFFESAFRTPDAERLLALSDTKVSEFENEDSARAALAALFADRDSLSYTSVSAANDSAERMYIVKSGDFKVASFTLAPNGKGDYEPRSVKLFLPRGNRVRCTVLANSTLYVNGVAVTEAYITERSEHEAAAYLPDGVKAPEWVTYEVNGLFNAPVLSVTDRNGAHPALVGENADCREQVLYDTPDAAIVETLTAAAKQYAKCMQNDASKASVLKYFERGTDLYASIRSAENTFVWEHSGFAFEDEKTSEFFRYDEHTVSLRISFTHVLKKAGRADYRDRVDITFFAHDTAENGGYLIFAMHNN